MSQSLGTIITRKFKPEEFPQTLPDKSNEVAIVKTERDLDSNLHALQQHQTARMAEIARQQEKILVATSNRTVAEQRGKKAEQILKLKQFSDLQQSQKALNAKMKALRMERERAGFIASLPPPPKDPLKTLLEKYDNGQINNQEPRKFFKNITKETDLKMNDARIDAILVQEKENQVKEKHRERIDDFDDKTNERFCKAIRKEQLINSRKEVMWELEKAYKADRIKQQKRIDTDQQIPPSIIPRHRGKIKLISDENAEKAVKQVFMDSNVNFLDVDSSFITTRRKKKNSEHDSCAISLPFQEAINFYSPLASDNQRTMTEAENETNRYLEKDSAIFSGDATINGTNVSLEYAQVQISLTNDGKIKPEKAVVNTETQTDIPHIDVSEKTTIRLSPISFFSLPNEIIRNELSSNNHAEQYKLHLLHRAKKELFFKPLPQSESSLLSPVPLTPGIPSTIETSSSSVWASRLCSDVSSTPKLPQNEGESASTESSSKLSAQIRKVLQKYIEKESLEQNERVNQNENVLEKPLPQEDIAGDYSKLAFKPKMPTKFFSDCISPNTNTFDAIPKVPARHRIFPVAASLVEDKAENQHCTSNSKLTPIIEVVSPNETLSISPSLKSDTSTTSQTSNGSSKSLSDSKTKHLSQSSYTELKIPSYIQHKFLTDKMKSGFMDEPIETIDDLRELLACLPSGMKLEECLRTKPPISYPFWMAMETEPHELSTIPEVDTPQTSFNYSAESRMILPKASGFFTHLSIGDSNPYLSSNTPESSKHLTPCSATVSTPLGSAVKSLPSTVSSSVSSYSSGDQLKWADILKLNRKPGTNSKSSSISSFSPGNVEALDPIRVNSQSTPVKNSNQTEDEFDLLSENITLIGPEVTVSNRGTSTHCPPDKSAMSAMSESLLSFLKHEEEANSHPCSFNVLKF